MICICGGMLHYKKVCTTNATLKKKSILHLSTVEGPPFRCSCALGNPNNRKTMLKSTFKPQYTYTKTKTRLRTLHVTPPASTKLRHRFSTSRPMSSSPPMTEVKFASNVEEDTVQSTEQLHHLLQNGWTLDENQAGVRKKYHFKTYTKALVYLFPIFLWGYIYLYIANRRMTGLCPNGRHRK